jgi:P4 family phage/plasmid primase-like protien
MNVQFENIPVELKKINRWVMWKFMEVGEGESKRLSKLPMQINGASASSTNPKHWSDFFAVEKAYQTGKFSGVGFVFSQDDNLVGIDIDDCRDPTTGELTEFAQNIIDNVEGYVEVSPSETGVKIFTRADLKHAHVDHTIGLECYNTGRYFTVTGALLQGSVPASEQVLTNIIPERVYTRSGDEFEDFKPVVEGYDIHRVETEILSELDPNTGYDEWLRIGQALHHQFGGDVEACEAWDRWSAQTTGDYSATGKYSCETKWRTFSGSGVTLRSLIFKVNQKKIKEALDNGDIILNQNVMSHARTFLDNYYRIEEGYKLVHYADDFYLYSGTHYEVIEELTIRSDMYHFLDKCKKLGRKQEILPFNPNPAAVSAAIDAVKSIIHLPNHANTKPPIWLKEYVAIKPPASKLISLKNGLFHVDEQALISHSLGFFTQNSLNFDYNPNAKCPRWEQFMTDIWEDDIEAIHTLQEMFGYVLSGDTQQQKFFNMIGPRRSGKGTINKILVSLLGQHNTVAPELGELCDTFGLQPWLGKLLASFTDARAPERNRNAVVSQLLRIVGGDTITVNRKNKEAWNGYLPTRIVIYSNEVLQLTENSNALTGRMIVLKMTKTFYGNEDTELAIKLESELSGIFNWAMEGLRRRLERGGHFIQPKSGASYLELMSELGNPIGSFVEDTLVFDPTGTVSKDDVFTCYSHWAMKKKLAVGTEFSFKRRFLAATQEHRIEAGLDRSDGRRVHTYMGVKLNEKAQLYINSIVTFDEDGAY